MTEFNIIHNEKTSSTLCGEIAGTRRFYVLGILVLSLIAFAPVVDASCSCNAGNWDPSGFLNSELGTSQPVQPGSAQGSAAGNSGSSTQKPLDRVDSFPNGEILKLMKSVSSSDLVLDASNDNSYNQSHIKGALHFSSNSFLNEDGTLKPVSELAKILGDAGVSRKDPVVIYGDDLADSTFIFWTLRYLGHDDVKVLDGSLDDWKAAKLPFEASQNTRPAANYTPSVRQELLADYKNVTSGSALIVDARPFMEFSKARIPTSISMDFTKVLENGKIKNRDALTNVFSGLAKNKPVIVYSSDYNRASLLWYALQLMGYNAKIYTWKDWAAHQPASDKNKTALTGKNNTNTGRFKNLGTT